MIAQEVSAWNTAMKLIETGLRPPIVHATTGLCRNRLRKLYKTVHGRSASQGRVSEFAYSRLKTRNQVIEGTRFYHIYCRLGGDRIFQVLDPDLFLEAFKQYKSGFPKNIGVETAWLIARDLRESSLIIRHCKDCDRDFLYDHRSDQMIQCPICAG